MTVRRGAFTPFVAVLFATAMAGACRAKEMPMANPATTDAAPEHASVLPVEAAVGSWALRAAEGPGRCLLALNSEPAGTGRHGLHIESCTIATLDAAAGWRPTTGGFDLLARDGGVLMRFRRTGVDSFETEGYRLERALMR